MTTTTRSRAILATASHLFAEKGYSQTTTAEIAREAGVAEGTLYHHFGSKDGIFLTLFDETMEGYLAGIEALLARDDGARDPLRLRPVPLRLRLPAQGAVPHPAPRLPGPPDRPTLRQPVPAAGESRPDHGALLPDPRPGEGGRNAPSPLPGPGDGRDAARVVLRHHPPQDARPHPGPPSTARPDDGNVLAHGARLVARQE